MSSSGLGIPSLRHKNFQPQASQNHLAGLAIAKKKRLSSKQKAKQLLAANAFSTRLMILTLPPQGINSMLLTSPLPCDQRWNLIVSRSASSSLFRQIDLKRTKFMISDHGLFSPRPAVAFPEGDMTSCGCFRAVESAKFTQPFLLIGC